MTLDQYLSIVNIFVSVIMAIIIYRISNKLSAKNAYDHEIYISDQLSEMLGRKAVLVDVKKYNSDNDDVNNKDYYKQACGIQRIIQNYGVVVSLRGGDNGFELGLIPFNWIEYIRKNDSEDACYIMVCKFKGMKWYKNFKSPIKKILKAKV